MTDVPLLFHYRRMSSKRLDLVTDYVREGLNLCVECKCGRVVILPANKIRDECFERSLPMAISQLEIRLRCLRCRRRGHARVGPIG